MRFILIVLIIFVTTRLLAQIDSVRMHAVADTIKVPHTTWTHSKYIRQSIVPVSLAVGGLTIMAIPNLKENIQKNLNWNNITSPNYINLGEDYVRYAPTIAAYALGACGLKSTHRFIDRTIILTASCIVSDFVVYNTKNIVKELRPNGDERTSFPSQHTAMAFVAATFLDHELGYISPWISVGGYLSASYVGYCRLAQNAHYTNDVLMGAAVGIIMTNATYWAYDGVMKLFPKNLTIAPISSLQQTGLYVCYKF